MPTFRKSDLIAAAQTAIAAQAEADTAYEAAKDKAVIEHNIKRWERTTPQLRALRDLITKSLKNNRTPTLEEARIATFGGDRTDLETLFPTDYEERNVRNRVDRPGPVGVPVSEYRGLISFLEALEDETVTTSALKTVGFTGLGALFKVAAQSSATLDNA